MMQAYVINLERKPDRLVAFHQHMQSAGLDQVFRFQPFTAIDGQKLDLETLKLRVSESNWAQRERLRGHLGCTLSHLECWRRIASGSETVAIFEDDARIAEGVNPALIRAAIDNLPGNASLVWLNDYNYWARESLKLKIKRKLSSALGKRLAHRSVTFAPMPDILSTMEAYVLSPAFAQRLYDGIANNLGAVDRHVQLLVAKSGLGAIQSVPALFTQADRSDSSTLV